MTTATHSGLNPTKYSIAYDLDSSEVLGLYLDDDTGYTERVDGDWELVTDDSVYDHPFLYVTENAVQLFDDAVDRSGTMEVSNFYEVLS